MQEWREGRDAFGCALMHSLAGTACLPLPWLHLKAILIVWLRSFVQAQRLLNCLLTPPPTSLLQQQQRISTNESGGGGVVKGAHAPSMFVKFTQFNAPPP
jgi:hypothetical protein